MLGYKVKINALPKLRWACETTVDSYRWQNRNSKDMLEISYAKFENQTVTVNRSRQTLRNNALSCVVADEARGAVCDPEKTVTIVSVAVRLQDFSFEPCEITEADCGDTSTLLLPAYIDDLPLPHELELLKTLHSLIKFSSSGAENETAAFVSCFFKLLCQVDGITREYIGSKAQRGNYYIKKVDYIIESSYGEKVTLQSVAAELNISPVYLSAVYKSGCGINFSEQLLNVRMRHAERMLLDQNIPTAKVAELCGFCDENYFRKKFRQFFGMNVREYRKIKNGLTLYHKKPQNTRQG